MQAVLAPGSALPRGLLESGMGAVVFVVLLILFLRLVDSGSEGDLPRTALEPQLFDLHVPGPRRPPEYLRHALPPKQPRRAEPHLAISSARSSSKRQDQARKPPPINSRCLVVFVLCGDARAWRGCGLVIHSRCEVWGCWRWLLR